MFQKFSRIFEKSFRTFFIFWVIGWFLVNGLTLLFSYISFLANADNYTSDADIISWFTKIVSLLVSLVLGLFLMFVMFGINDKIKKRIPITNLSLIAFLAFAYYLFSNTINLIDIMIFSDNLRMDLIFQLAWLLPSLVILVIHMFYVSNLGAYNNLLEQGKNPLEENM